MGVKVKVGDSLWKFIKLGSAWSGQLPDLGLKTPHAARPQIHRGVKNQLKMLIYSLVSCVFSLIFALSCTHLNNSKTASNNK
jgi:hypothetical protein